MQTCIIIELIKSKTVPQTLLLIKNLNNLLDILNSRTLYDSNPYKCALFEDRPQQMHHFLKTKSSITSLKKVTNQQARH